jgi:hypothetical protein
MLHIIYLKTIIEAYFVGMFAIYLGTNFHLYNCNDSLLIAVEPKAAKFLRIIAMLLLYILKETVVTKCTDFPMSITIHYFRILN